MSARSLRLLTMVLLVACGAATADSRKTVVRPSTSVPPRGPDRPAAGAGNDAALALQRAASPAVRALYVNRFASQSTARMRHLVALADSTEINALVIETNHQLR